MYKATKSGNRKTHQDKCSARAKQLQLADWAMATALVAEQTCYLQYQ
jgi:endogenous inhibitor of DNA gyrase (YacG/DUF329 family)